MAVALKVEASAPTRLARRLDTFDAVVIGLGAMIGAGVFAAFGPAARAAGNGLLAGLVIAAFVAYCNATSSRTIPRAIPLALGITLLVYGLVAVSALAGAGASAVAASVTPLATAVEAGRLAWLSPAVRVGAAVASLGVLLSLIVGVSRTTFAMASNGDLPSFLSAVHPRYRVPHRAELMVGATVAIIVTAADIRSAIGFSSVTVLTYYAIAKCSSVDPAAE